MNWNLQNREHLIDRVSLEISLKPFYNLTNQGIRETCQQLFEQWMPLLRKSKKVSVMLWSADGSEILEYRGNFDDHFSWAKWIGMADSNSLEEEIAGYYNLHAKAELYRQQLPDFSYRDLYRIVKNLKDVGEQRIGSPVEVGTTFDPGGEFAQSTFKFGKHNEIAAYRLDGGTFRWVTCTARLHEDSNSYAGFPDGIAEGTHLGTFLGAQTQRFLSDMDMDFIWFSNGFAFAANAWSMTGQLFDGEKFDNSKAERLRDEILLFWKLFRQECPHYRIECRGSNLGTGMDICAHGSPMKELYEGGFNFSAPPNSPWAAIDGNYGLELTGWLSHIAQLPDSGLFPFRYYLHDPWWLNSPWFDRYGRDPHDIYLPLALARFDKQGYVNKPTCINLLSVDTSYGELPDRGPIDITTHLIRALDDYPNEPGILTWAYPFDEYDHCVRENRLSLPFFGDWVVTGAINQGLPVSGVISMRNLVTTIDTFAKTNILMMIPDAGSAAEKTLYRCIQKGINVLLYGPVDNASDELLQVIGVCKSKEAIGQLHIEISAQEDQYVYGFPSQVLEHDPRYSAGSINTISAGKGSEVLASVFDENGSRFSYATYREQRAGNGSIAWIRGSFNYSISPRLPKPYSSEERYPSEQVFRYVLSRFGVQIRFQKRTLSTATPVLVFAKRDNGYFFSGYNPDMSTDLYLRLAQGIPLFVGCETWIENNMAVYRFGRSWHYECRVLVQNQKSGILSCRESFPLHTAFRRRIIVSGVENATVIILPETMRAHPLHLFMGDSSSAMPKESLHYDIDQNGYCTLKNVTGTLQMTW